MKVTVDFKSLVIGVLIATVLFLSLGTTQYHATRHGRFQLIIIDGYAFVFDNESGRVWQKTISGYVSQNIEEAKSFYGSKI